MSGNKYEKLIKLGKTISICDVEIRNVKFNYDSISDIIIICDFLYDDKVYRILFRSNNDSEDKNYIKLYEKSYDKNITKTINIVDYKNFKSDLLDIVIRLMIENDIEKAGDRLKSLYNNTIDYIVDMSNKNIISEKFEVYYIGDSNEDVEKYYQKIVEYEVKRYLSYIEGYKMLDYKFLKLLDNLILVDVINKLKELGYDARIARGSNSDETIRVLDSDKFGPREYYYGLITIYWDDENKEE